MFNIEHLAALMTKRNLLMHADVMEPLHPSSQENNMQNISHLDFTFIRCNAYDKIKKNKTKQSD